MKLFPLFITLLGFCFAINSVYCQATVYATAEDFGKEESEEYKEVVQVKKSLILTLEDGSATVYNLKKNSIWGYRNKFGEEFRINQKGKAMKIVEFGAICVYSNSKDIETTTNPDLNPNWKDRPYTLTKEHSFSVGPTGKIIKFSASRFLKALKGNESAYEKFKKLILDRNPELLLKIIDYNMSIETKSIG